MFLSCSFLLCRNLLLATLFGFTLAAARPWVMPDAASLALLAGSAVALESRADRGARAATAALRVEHHHLDGERDRLVRGARHANRSATGALDLAASRVAALDPQRALDRGWVVLRSGGRVVRRIADVTVGDEIEATLADGHLTAMVAAASPHPAPDDE